MEYNLTKSASQLDRDEIEMDLMLVNMENNIYLLISTIILPKVLILCYSVHLETLGAIYWN